MVVSESIAAGWMGVHSSIGAGAMLEISSRVSLRKLVICVAVAVMSDGPAGIGRGDISVDSGSFAMFRSKMGVSKSLSSVGSTSTSIGRSSSSSVVRLGTEAVVGMGYAYTNTGNENRF
uniref:Secreted protein n=1 Tax=Romanomermis culicivorax TaxID=13658 RepID=A0A915L2J0_ROMCU